MKPMETLQDLIEEAKLRTVWWALCIFSISYLLSHTSKSMWMNIPVAILLASGLRILFSEVEFRWKVRNVRPHTYLSHLEKKQLSLNDSRLSTPPLPLKWKQKIDSPLVESAMEDFINKIIQDFVVDLWYSDITPDKEAPELIHAIVMDALGEISGRVKEMNLVDLLTRDVVDLIGDHLELFRRNEAAIGLDVMGTLSSEERDERLKHHLLASKELHPALISAECEYKVLQQLMGGVLAIVLRPREAQCPLVRCIAQELLTSLVMQPLLNFASPGYINELIEYIFLAFKDEGFKMGGGEPNIDSQKIRTQDHMVAADHVGPDESLSSKNASSFSQETYIMSTTLENRRELAKDASGDALTNMAVNEPMQPRPADWARVLEAATQRRTEVLMPENLENMWAIGRNYKKKFQKNVAAVKAPGAKGSWNSVMLMQDQSKGISIENSEISHRIDYNTQVQLPARPYSEARSSDHSTKTVHLSQDLNEFSSMRGAVVGELENTTSFAASGNKNRLKRSSSTSDLSVPPKTENLCTSDRGGPIISEFYSPNLDNHNQICITKRSSDTVLLQERSHIPKLKCRVLGAYFEKLGSKSFAVYSIAVTDADRNTWFVKRRYRNFERLHRHLKDIPNYTLHLPPKRIFSSSTEDAFVHQRCIQLDKYLQNLLSIANVAEQHEVWDFLSVSSKNYSFGKSSSVMRTLAVNVDDAVDDIVRQFKGVSDGLMRKVVGSPSSSQMASAGMSMNMAWNVDEINKLVLRHGTAESANSFSDTEEGDRDVGHGLGEVESTTEADGWHSDSELNSKGFPPRVANNKEEIRSLDPEKSYFSGTRSESLGISGAIVPATSDELVDPIGMPPEWTPPNLSVPLLNLVDKIFQLNRRGWLRRQVFWISKQILQLVMEDAIDDWLLRQIHWLRREDVIAQGIQWVQDVLWPGGTFFVKLNSQIEADGDKQYQRFSQAAGHLSGIKVSKQGSFEEQLEAARRASEVKKMIFSGAPTTLVSLIGHRQYKRCAKDIYYFLQSTICLKQMAYGILELLLISLFPELRDLVLDVHKKMRAQPVYARPS